MNNKIKGMLMMIPFILFVIITMITVIYANWNTKIGNAISYIVFMTIFAIIAFESYYIATLGYEKYKVNK